MACTVVALSTIRRRRGAVRLAAVAIAGSLLNHLTTRAVVGRHRPHFEKAVAGRLRQELPVRSRDELDDDLLGAAEAIERLEVQPMQRDPSSTSRRVSRRTVLASAATAAAIAACGRRTPAGRAEPFSTDGVDEFRLLHNGASVRCLYHVARVAPPATGSPPLRAVILLHGAAADATQWVDIGMSAVSDQLVATGQSDPFVVVAPDIADHSTAYAMVLDALLPAVAARFSSRAPFGISGISRGGATALTCATTEPLAFRSVGLHSPAVDRGAELAPVDWRAWIDVGHADSLADGARRLAQRMRDAGITVEEHDWAGGHDRAYWRAHLPEYLAFHAND